MRRRFAWFIVGGAAFAALANPAANLRAGTPLATLRQAVTPAHRPLPTSLPVVTTEPDESGPAGSGRPTFATDRSPLIDAGLSEPVSSDLVPSELVPIESPRSGMSTAPVAPVEASLAAPSKLAGPTLAPPPVREPTVVAIPAAAEPSGPAFVAVEANEPVVVAAPPKTSTPAPVAGAASAEPAKIERLPSDVVGPGTAASDDVNYRKPLSAIGIGVAPTAGVLPPNDAAAYYGGAAGEVVVPRGQHDTLFFWQATNLCHRPLYFEQDYLERDGRSFGPVQPIVSGVQFFGSVPLLPYRMVRQPPCRCIYTLGESRPDGYRGR